MSRRRLLAATVIRLQRYASDLEAQLERMKATARLRASEHESDLREIDRLRSEMAARDVADAVDELGLEDLGGHRHCVSMATHLAVVNELDRLSTEPRAGGAL